MKKKIIGILVITLFITTTVLPVLGTINEQVNEDNIDSSYITCSKAGFIKFPGVPGEPDISAGISIIITNIFEEVLRDIEWTFDAEGGIILFGDGARGRIPVLGIGEETTINLRPVPFIFQDADGQSPIGFGSITLMATAETSTATGEVTGEALLIGPVLIL